LFRSSKLVVGPLFGFFAGWMVDRFGPRRLMLAGILMAGAALIGLGSISTLGMFYFFYMLNALGYVCGGPLPSQVLLSRWFERSRGKAMGFAYLGIGLSGAAVPWISHTLVQHFGWQAALRTLGLLILVIALPAALLAKEPPHAKKSTVSPGFADARDAFTTIPFFLLTLGSMFSIAAVSGAQQNLKLFLSLDLHFAQSQAARILSLVLAFSIVGRLLMGWLADRFPKKYVMVLIYMLVAAAIPLLFAGRAPAAIYIFAAVFGVGLGGDYMIVPLMAAKTILRLGALKDVARFQEHVQALQLNIPCDSTIVRGAESPLRKPLVRGEIKISNRIAVQPMEGWDGTADGNPSEHTVRRWK